jgi:cephalosporin-C deacetylase-like acetyl esterase
MRTDIAFKAEDGTMLRGWHYLPDRRSGPVPTIVMAHGFSAVKEMFLDRFAEAFAAAGLAALVYDNRNFGASDGEPRCRRRSRGAGGSGPDGCRSELSIGPLRRGGHAWLS